MVGITQAKEAASLALEERLARFTFTYDTDGPHLNPRLLAEHGPDTGPEQTKAQTPDQEPSRLTLLSPSPTSPPVQPTPTDCSTSLEKKKSGGPRNTAEKRGKRKQSTSTLKTTTKTKVLVSHKGQTQMPSQVWINYNHFHGLYTCPSRISQHLCDFCGKKCLIFAAAFLKSCHTFCYVFSHVNFI